jgi:hypothetical protein
LTVDCVEWLKDVLPVRVSCKGRQAGGDVSSGCRRKGTSFPRHYVHTCADRVSIIFLLPAFVRLRPLWITEGKEPILVAVSCSCSCFQEDLNALKYTPFGCCMNMLWFFKVLKNRGEAFTLWLLCSLDSRYV